MKQTHDKEASLALIISDTKMGATGGQRDAVQSNENNEAIKDRRLVEDTPATYE